MGLQSSRRNVFKITAAMWTSLVSNSTFSPRSILVWSSRTTTALADLLKWWNFFINFKIISIHWPKDPFCFKTIRMRQKVDTLGHNRRNVCLVVLTDPLYRHPKLLCWCPAEEVSLCGSTWLALLSVKTKKNIGYNFWLLSDKTYSITSLGIGSLSRFIYWDNSLSWFTYSIFRPNLALKSS